MAKTKTPSAQSFAAEAQRQFDELKSALQSARAELGSLNRSLHVAVIKTPRTKIPKSTSGGLSFLDTLGAGLFSGLLASEFGGGNASANLGGLKLSGSFQPSSTQSAGQLLDDALRGQRIR